MNKKILLILCFTFGLIYFFVPSSVFAQEKIDSFDVELTARKDGAMIIEEKIIYDFGQTQRHGIFRDIPLISIVGELYRIIKIDFEEILKDGEDEKYSVNYSPENVQIKIGDPDKTISGPHTYLIIYKVENAIGSNFENHDEIYWNITGNEWTVPIMRASALIKTDFGVLPEKTICFTGSQGSKESSCRVEILANGHKIIAEGLLPQDGLTTVSAFVINTFPKSILQKSKPVFDQDFISFIKIYLPIISVLNFILAPVLLFWYNRSKSKLRFGPPSVNFDIPKYDKNTILRPSEAGIIDNTILEKNDVVATIFDLAIRKYIKIKEEKIVRRLMPDTIDYKIIKLREYKDLNSFETMLLDRLFEDGDEILLKDLKKDFYKTFADLETEGFNMLVDKKLYIKNPKTQKTALFVGGLFSIFTLGIILGAVLIFLSKKLNGRTQLGDKLDWEIDGFKIFLKAMSRHYSWQAKNLITVEKYIPYAIALGLQDEFMEQLKIIYPDYKPTWYAGSANFYSGFSGFYSSVNTNVTTTAPSSSSGFSGGSSGGGGGGGGGGSW